MYWNIFSHFQNTDTCLHMKKSIKTIDKWLIMKSPKCWSNELSEKWRRLNIQNKTLFFYVRCSNHDYRQIKLTDWPKTKQNAKIKAKEPQRTDLFKSLWQNPAITQLRNLFLNYANIRTCPGKPCTLNYNNQMKLDFKFLFFFCKQHSFYKNKSKCRSRFCTDMYQSEH